MARGDDNERKFRSGSSCCATLIRAHKGRLRADGPALFGTPADLGRPLGESAGANAQSVKERVAVCFVGDHGAMLSQQVPRRYGQTGELLGKTAAVLSLWMAVNFPPQGVKFLRTDARHF